MNFVDITFMVAQETIVKKEAQIAVPRVGDKVALPIPARRTSDHIFKVTHVCWQYVNDQASVTIIVDY